MATIDKVTHSVCLDCSENEFVVTGNLNEYIISGPTTTNSLSVTDPNGNVVVYDNATITDDLYTAPFTYTVSAGSTIITGGGSVSQATLNWTATAVPQSRVTELIEFDPVMFVVPAVMV